ncbi:MULTISPECIES: hypothetical protein [Gammaproteobacteria]|uniref:hypothetical protein n=1 Tax=Gammaproteobacteria TaxID=1236 RepID=UPI000DCF90E9|nr:MULTISPECIES: hypothetical protein [Gammaproteobacteria]RTE87659.1 hypothetical protein DQX04_04635 [Aliidiomarina sp. B3213]TCZ92557.1 hypothetical protein EYQ95_00660 [Lysobacter sp. N42]
MKTLIIASSIALTFAASTASANPLTDLAQEVRQEVQVTNLVSKVIDMSEIRNSLRQSAVELYSRLTLESQAQVSDEEDDDVEAESAPESQEKAPE